jgi:sodium/proline symporter
LFNISAPTLVEFTLYFMALIGIGVLAFRRNRNLSDFALGGRRLTSTETALSAGASDMSGWLLLGFPGAVYAAGIGATWIAIGLIIGTYLNWRVVAPRLRVYTQRAGESVSLPGYLEERFEDPTRILRFVSAAVILVFFTVYVSSGLIAGGLLFEEAFGIDSTLAVTVAVTVIAVYTAMGGFLAVSRTHLLQAGLMVFALFALPVIEIIVLGGIGPIVQQLGARSPDLLDMGAGASFADGHWSAGASLGAVAIISGLAWGLGYPGQPHILTRFMAIRKPEELREARRINVTWVTIVLVGASLVGLLAITLLDDPLRNPETAFFAVTDHLAFPWIAGILLVAVLAAILSTADSQLLVSATTLTEDFYRAFLKRQASDRRLLWMGRATVVGVAVIAYALALGGGSVLDIVAWAWAGFGAAFGPVIVLSLFWPRMSWAGALAGIVTGALTVTIWPLIDPFDSGVYEIVPGWVAASVAAWLFGRYVGRPPRREWALPASGHFDDHEEPDNAPPLFQDRVRNS